MIRYFRRALYVGAALSALSLLIVGCSNSTAPINSAPATKDSGEFKQSDGGSGSKPTGGTDGGDHGHKASAHGGILVPIGSDSYHAEAVFEKGGILRLFTLGQNEAAVLEVEAQPLTGYVKIEGGMESESFILAPKPQAGDKAGMTSLFVGHLPKEMAGKKLDVTIPAIRIGTDRFRIAFKSTPDAGGHDMPSKVADEEEKKLYLTPGGKYTEADIKANGTVTASQKFKGFKATHDLKPKTGDKICPVTLTLANSKFSWVVDGKTYEFCCPPCVDEFVTLAKEKPGEIKSPEEYRQK